MKSDIQFIEIYTVSTEFSRITELITLTVFERNLHKLNVLACKHLSDTFKIQSSTARQCNGLVLYNMSLARHS
jgi:hypothetical protein